MEPKKRVPVFSIVLCMLYSRGLYEFYCKTVAKLASIALAILQNCKSAEVKGTNAIKLVLCLWIVHHTENKLEGIDSISTSVCDNAICDARRKNEKSICCKCYASSQQKRQIGLKEHNILNGIIIRNILIPIKAFKAIQFISKYVRVESFGDVANVIQARNYIRLLKAFPRKTCVIFSKNLKIWKMAIDAENGLPQNTSFVFSSSHLNEKQKFDRKEYPFVNHRFTVYSKEYAKEHNIAINCRKKCISCLKKKENCFFKNDVFDISELLK